MKVPTGIKRCAAMVILENQERFLLLRRAKPPNRGLFVPVGGKLEPFESPASAARRETEEETGIRLSPDQLRFCGVLVETSPTPYNWTCHIYRAGIPDQPPPDCPEGELAWIPFDRLDQLPTPPTDWWVYQYVRDAKPFVFSALYDNSLKIQSMEEEIEGRSLPINSGYARP